MEETEYSCQLVANYNRFAMSYLEKKDYSSALTLLNKARALLKSTVTDPNLHATTYNNLGAYYIQTGANTLALRFFLQALEQASSNTLQANSHLKLCGLRSRAGDHLQALHHAKTAVKLLAAEPGIRSILALRSLGQELSALGRFRQASEIFTRGLSLSKSLLGVHHKLTQALQKQLQALPELLRSVSPVKKLPSVLKPSSITPMPQSSFLHKSFFRGTQAGQLTTKKSARVVKARKVFRRLRRHSSLERQCLYRQTFGVTPNYTRTEAAVLIQRQWRKYCSRKWAWRRAAAHARAAAAVQDLEELKKQLKQEDSSPQRSWELFAFRTATKVYSSKALAH